MTPFQLLEKKILPREAHIAWAISKGVSTDEAIQHWDELIESLHFVNDEYVVIQRPCPKAMNTAGIDGLMWLSIRRKDNKKIRKWTDLQSIKNLIFGSESEAVEIFPAESRKADTVNQYHLFGGAECRFPIGFGSKLCSG